MILILMNNKVFILQIINNKWKKFFFEVQILLFSALAFDFCFFGLFSAQHKNPAPNHNVPVHINSLISHQVLFVYRHGNPPTHTNISITLQRTPIKVHIFLFSSTWGFIIIKQKSAEVLTKKNLEEKQKKFARTPTDPPHNFLYINKS